MRQHDDGWCGFGRLCLICQKVHAVARRRSNETAVALIRKIKGGSDGAAINIWYTSIEILGAKTLATPVRVRWQTQGSKSE